MVITTNISLQSLQQIKYYHEVCKNCFLLPRKTNTCNTVGVEAIAESIMRVVNLIYTDLCFNTTLTECLNYSRHNSHKTIKNISKQHWFTWDKWSKILSWAITMAAGASTSDINSQHADVVCLPCAAVSQSCGFARIDSSDYLIVVGWGSTRIHRLSFAFLWKAMHLSRMTEQLQE